MTAWSCVLKVKLKRSEIPWFLDFKLQPHDELESDETTIARIERRLSLINNGEISLDRQNDMSRVFSHVTSMNRELRECILLDGKHLIGSDLRNSQPLIASIIIGEYWKGNGKVPDDVLEYQNLCEQGQFYDYFMKLNGVPPNLRQQFKIEFFARVFFSIELGRPNILKDQFIQKYPSCYKAILAKKGGYFRQSYKDFARMLQALEADIFINRINLPLLETGMRVFSIHDAVYVNNIADYEVVQKKINEVFNDLGIRPTLEPVYYDTHGAN